MYTWITTVWSILEPILFFLPPLFNLKYKNHSKVDKDQYLALANNAFNDVVIFLVKLGLKKRTFAPGRKQSYIDDLLEDSIFKNGFYYFRRGEIEYYFLNKFVIPDQKSFKHFAIYAYLFLRGYKRIFKHLLRNEFFVRYFTRRKTIYHYLSIPGWSKLKHNELIAEVEKVKHIEPRDNEKYAYQDLHDFSINQPTIARAIDEALKKGVISERTIHNLAATEKLIIVYKYAEGFSSVYNAQREMQVELKERIKTLEISEDEDVEERLTEAKQQLSDLKDGWVRAPIGTVLEGHGFQKLFNRMEGVYVFPLSMLPKKYQDDPENYISEIVLKEAKLYLRKLKRNNPLLSEFKGDLKYIVLSQVIPLSKFSIFQQGRSLSLASPILYRMLFTSYLLNEDSEFSNLYINDLVRNLDFRSLLNESTKTGKYLLRNFEHLKKKLWEKLQIDVYKPNLLSALSIQQIEEICNELQSKDDTLATHYVRKELIRIVKFYKQLNQELDSLKVRK